MFFVNFPGLRVDKMYKCTRRASCVNNYLLGFAYLYNGLNPTRHPWSFVYNYRSVSGSVRLWFTSQDIAYFPRQNQSGLPMTSLYLLNTSGMMPVVLLYIYFLNMFFLAVYKTYNKGHVSSYSDLVNAELNKC